MDFFIVYLNVNKRIHIKARVYMCVCTHIEKRIRVLTISFKKISKKPCVYMLDHCIIHSLSFSLFIAIILF